MPKSSLTADEILEQFYLRFASARKLTPAASTEKERALCLRKALAVSGITKTVAEDVLDVPADWWWCEELKVWLPPVERLPPLGDLVVKP